MSGRKSFESCDEEDVVLVVVVEEDDAFAAIKGPEKKGWRQLGGSVCPWASTLRNSGMIEPIP